MSVFTSKVFCPFKSKYLYYDYKALFLKLIADARDSISATYEFRYRDEKVEQEKLSGINWEEEKLLTTKLVRENSCY